MPHDVEEKNVTFFRNKCSQVDLLAHKMIIKRSIVIDIHLAVIECMNRRVIVDYNNTLS